MCIIYLSLKNPFTISVTQFFLLLYEKYISDVENKLLSF